MNYIQQTIVEAVPTVDTSAYAAGDLIGGKLTFTAALNELTKSAELRAVTIIDQAKNDKDYNLVIFGDNPTGTTFTDQAAFDIADADMSKILTVVSVTSFTGFSDNGISLATEIARPLKSLASTASRTLYGALVAAADPTFAAASDVRIRLHIVQD